jgi:hypothetical protein
MKTLRRVLLLAVVVGAVGAWFGLRWLEQSYEQPYCLVEKSSSFRSLVRQRGPQKASCCPESQSGKLQQRQSLGPEQAHG